MGIGDVGGVLVQVARGRGHVGMGQESLPAEDVHILAQGSGGNGTSSTKANRMTEMYGEHPVRVGGDCSAGWQSFPPPRCAQGNTKPRQLAGSLALQENGDPLAI